MTDIVFIADFFTEQGVSGGAEAFNDELIKSLIAEGYNIEKVNSHTLTADQIKNNKFYIVSNFINLNNHNKALLKNTNYIILEHDHKYVSTNDPSKFINMLAPSKNIINKNFFEGAKAVFCQSKIHAEVLQKNLLINHVVNIGCNLWSDKDLKILKKYINIQKTKKNIILYSKNKNKGMNKTIQYCKKNNIEFEFIYPNKYENFIKQLATAEKVYFFPEWLESFNRVVIEARILGCKVISNNLIGATSEPWFKRLKGLELIDFIKNKKKETILKFVNVIEDRPVEFIEPIKIPKVSIICSLYKGGEYIEHFMSEVVKQTIFEKCELIILDANSPDKEYEVIEEYIKKYNNIFYERLEKVLNVQETMNLGIKKSSGEYLALWNVDDTRAYNSLEVMAKTLSVDPLVDLVYADSYQTNVKNETFANNSSHDKLYEHSTNTFSKENMIKCLPGPLPMWRKTMNESNGMFNTELKFAGDWEMWLRCVQNGSTFKKIPEVLGLYYYNPYGLSTMKKNTSEKLKEESSIFNKYKNIFGIKNYNMFKEYFNG